MDSDVAIQNMKRIVNRASRVVKISKQVSKKNASVASNIKHQSLV